MKNVISEVCNQIQALKSDISQLKMQSSSQVMTNQVNDIMIHERSASILEKFASNIPDTINLPDFDMRSTSSIQNRSYEMNRSR